MEKIEPCPFCGKTPNVVRRSPIGFINKFLYTVDYIVVCNHTLCRIKPETPGYEDRETAIEVWNNRPKINMGLPM